MARRRRRRNSSRPLWIVGSLVIVAGVWTYGNFVSPVLEGDDSTPNAATDGADVAPSPFAEAPRLTSNRPDSGSTGAHPHVTEKGEAQPHANLKTVDPEKAKRAESLVAAGMKALTDGELVAARAYLTEAVDLGLPSQKTLDVRAALSRIGAETVFGSKIYKDDPFVSRYTIAAGDTLGKIANRFRVTDDFLAAINGISDKNRIRLGQSLKVVQGPFHVRVHKHDYRMDVYLQETFVKHYTVGLGADDSTPTGDWVVGTKLSNPTYYPPRGGNIVAADDADNPLGEHWIELKGVSGNALGQQRYGIHGTNEPNSIGHSQSMGCIRMHNADVADLFTYLITKHSTVTVTD